MISSQQSFEGWVVARTSYDGFLQLAWRHLSTPGVADQPIDGTLQALYDLAAEYNPLNVGAKVALTKNAGLHTAMAACVRAAAASGDRQVKLQTSGAWPILTLQRLGELATYYDAMAAHYGPRRAPKPAADEQADKITRRYLHIYPNPLRAIASNWRIEINLLPSAIAAGMAALVPLIDAHQDIGHMKFYMPGGARKADSVIVYIRKNDGRYAALQDAITTAVHGLARQARMGAMVDEIADGIGVATEPPKDLPDFHGRGGSFTAYRVLVVYIAFKLYMNRRVARRDFNDFYQLVTTQTMPLLGLDPAHPHLQLDVQADAASFPSTWTYLQTLRHIWKE